MLYRVIEEHLDAFLETARHHADAVALGAGHLAARVDALLAETDHER